MRKEFVVILGAATAQLASTMPAQADNREKIASEKSMRDADSPEAMYNDIIDRANKAGATTEKIPFIGKLLPGYKEGSKASRQILEDSKYGE